VSKSKTRSSDVSFIGLLSSTSVSVIGSSSIFTICVGDILKDKRLPSTGLNFPTACTLRDQRRGEEQELLGLSLDLKECFMNSGSTDLGVRGDEQVLSENEEVLGTNFPNELDFGLNSFFCSSSSMSNLSLANFIKLSRVTSKVSPAQQIKLLENLKTDNYCIFNEYALLYRCRIQSHFTLMLLLLYHFLIHFNKCLYLDIYIL